MSTTIFCPHCDALVLDAPRCPACGRWERPPAPSVAASAVLWRADLTAGLAAGLTLADGVLYACDTDGRLHALDAATGKPAWLHPADLGHWRVHRQVAVAGGLVIVGPADSRNIPLPDKAVLLLDAATGAVQRRYPLPARQISDPLVAGDTIFVATSDGQAVALALADGALRWRAPIAGFYQAAPARAADLIVFGGDKGALTALHEADGSRAWTFRAEPHPQWGNSFPYPPACAGGMLYATCWNCRCYALDAATGDVAWISGPTKRPPFTPPLATADALYFCSHDRFVYCLERGTGKLRWQTQLPRKSPTTPVLVGTRLYVASEDHRVYALDAGAGDLDPQPLCEMSRHVVGDWATDGERLYLGDADGHLIALRVRMPPEERDPAGLEAAGQWAEAAARHALAGAFVRAAEIYRDRLGESKHAAVLYERGGELALAAGMYLAAGEIEAARRLFRRTRDFARAAQLAEQLRDLAGAARDYRDAGLPAEAARVREQAEDLRGAAELYGEAGDLRKAADLYARAGDRRMAARRYEEAGLLLLAAAEWEQLQQWARAADLYTAAGEHRQAGEAWLRAGACERAAESFWRAAQAAQARNDPAEDTAALYERARQEFANCGEDGRAQECDRLRRWLRKQPLLEVMVAAPEELTVGASGRLTVDVTNVGWGMATDIRLEIRGQFEADTTRVNKPFGLSADRTKTLSVYIIPLRAGAQLPLHLTVAYRGPDGAAMPPLEETFDLTVRERAERQGDTTLQYIVQGNLIQAQQAGEVVVGEKWSVDIKRQAASAPPPAPAQPVSVGAPPEALQVVCAACGAAQPADRAKCIRCGIPFVQCAACRRALPERTPFCPHCGAGQE